MQKIVLLVVFFSFPALAEVHKCVNGGDVSYSEKPCVSGAVPYDAGRVSVGDSTTRSASIVRGAGGLFWAKGSVNGLPANFIVDTGATNTTLSGDLAYRLGMRNCVPAGMVSTANGTTSFCRVTVSRLSVAGFNFSNVSVVVNPTMRGEPLFGNDLLNQFTIQQQGDLLTLSR